MCPQPTAHARARLLFVTFAVILCATAALALDPSLATTQYVRESWSSNDGLPQDSVNKIARTPDGYLWLATQEGIARFDGLNFTVFDSRNTGGAVGGFVYTVLVDRSGTLWAGCGSGLVRYDGDGHFTKIDEAAGWNGSSAKFLSEAGDGGLWASFGNGTNIGGKGLIRYRNGNIRKLTTADGLPNGQVYETATAADGSVWIGTGNGLAIYRDGKFRTLTTADGLPDDFVRMVRRDRRGTMWIGTDHGLARATTEGFRIYTTKDGLLDDAIQCVFTDRDGVTWVGTAKGLNRIVGERIEAARQENGLADDTIFDIFEDDEGSLWIGTHTFGLHRLRAGRFTPLGTPEGLFGASAQALLEDRAGRIWIGTSPGGLNLLDDGTLHAWSEADGLATSNAKALMEDRSGAIWIGTTAGLSVFRDGRFTNYFRKDGLPSDAVNVIFQDRDGTIWVGTNAGLARWTGTNFAAVPLPNHAPVGVRVLFQDSSRRLWVGGSDGLGYLDGAGKFVAVFFSSTSDLNVVDVFEDDERTLWFSTWGDGLCRFKNGRVTRFGAANGLFDDISWSILDDRHGNFWLECNRGIYRVARRDLDAFADRKLATIPYVVYGTVDGMRSRETNLGWRSSIRTRDGRLWFATTQGVVTIDPAKLRINRVPPRVVIERVIAGERQVANAPDISFAAGTRSFEFEYTATSLTAPSRTRFRYRLDGFDDHWIESGTRRSARYTNIPPGDYTFRVVAANEDGVWSPSGASLRLKVKPFFYQRPWFFVLVLVAIVVLFALVNELRARQREIRHQVYHDPMTGLPNRRLLTERASVALTDGGRRGRSIALLFLDLDGFKAVNDQLGHAAGDRLLQLVASRFRGCIRDIDTLARIGGDEFAVLVAELTDETRAAEVAQRIIDAMREEFVFDGTRTKLGVSIGIAVHPFDGVDVKTMLQAADRAMYRAKLGGGNQYLFNAADPSETVTI